MTALPPSSDLVTTGITKGTFKTALSNLRAYLNGLFGEDGTQATALSTLGALLGGSVTVSAAGTTVGVTHRGKLIDCTGTGGWTLAVDACATLGAGFAFAARNSTSGTVTINPNLSEPIDDATTLDLAPGETCLVQVNAAATGLKTVGRTVNPGRLKVSSNDTTPGYLNGKLVAGANITLTEGSDGGDETLTIAASGLVSTDVGVSGVGMMATLINTTFTVAAGATVAGSWLSTDGDAPFMTGTWRNIGPQDVGTSTQGVFQRYL